MINGVISVPIMFVMMRMVANTKIMGKFVVGQRLSILGWLATGVMALAVSAMLVQLIVTEKGGSMGLSKA